jgi:hypothetical protein
MKARGHEEGSDLPWGSAGAEHPEGGLLDGFCLNKQAPGKKMETASRRQSATTRVWGSIGSAEIFAEGTAYTTTNDKVRRAPRWTGQTRLLSSTPRGTVKTKKTESDIFSDIILLVFLTSPYRNTPKT